MISVTLLLCYLLAYVVVFPWTAVTLPISKRFVPFVQEDIVDSTALGASQHMAQYQRGAAIERADGGQPVENASFQHGHNMIKDTLTEASFDKFIDYTMGNRKAKQK